LPGKAKRKKKRKEKKGRRKEKREKKGKGARLSFSHRSLALFDRFALAHSRITPRDITSNNNKQQSPTSMGCSGSREERRKNDEIEVFMHDEKRKFDNEVKLLLLGMCPPSLLIPPARSLFF
jgi:ribosomal protein S18